MVLSTFRSIVLVGTGFLLSACLGQDVKKERATFVEDPDTNAEGNAWLKKHFEDPEVNVLKSGFMYKVLKKGDGLDSPTASSPCECHYEGKLINGKEFDSSYKRGTPTTFAPNQVIKGWTEAMQLMVEGDKWEMFIPAGLAYGKRGAGGAIPPQNAITFKMELLKIKGAKKPKEQAELKPKEQAEL